MAEGDKSAGRAQYLIEGRRVMVADLLEQGLIEPGTRLRFDRNRIGQTFFATVTEQGRIRVDSLGEEFRSPSGAAMVAAGMRAVDGWRAWVVVGQERLLDSVRQELLDRKVASVHRQAPDAPHPAVHERLRRARERADNDDPERLTVRELLGFWGVKDRTDHIDQIEADLANHGLTTSPGFRAVTLDTVVSLTTPAGDVSEQTDEPEIADLRGVENDGGDDLNVRLTVGNLSPLSGVGFIGPDGTVEEAITKMALDDYSQLAVLNGPRHLRGAVTWRSIAQALQRKPDATVADAIDTPVEVVDYDRDLFEILPVLQQRYFVFVRDQTKEIRGIVTTADVAHRYGEMATPFFLLGEVDQTLRWIVRQSFELDEIRTICRRRITGFDDLSIGDYLRTLENEELWEKLQWSLDRVTFTARLEEIRLIRNKVMHFHSDPVPEDAVNKLRWFLDLLHQHRTQR
ncbi:CBS domain-containing protein [Saccharopolyspora sp. NPDC047091]|uniref:restriction system modified-DNA reader domain-containing protein n=1 Tax=Saccharopolyspora sp. NPDC047091 TaxID=3155924 RepID=UPI0033C96E35